MLPTEDLFVYVYVLIDDLINASASAIAIPPRPGPVPRHRAGPPPASPPQRGGLPGRGRMRLGTPVPAPAAYRRQAGERPHIRLNPLPEHQPI
jgi:hypothetical protein